MIFEKEYKKITSTRNMYGYVKLDAIASIDFKFTSHASWPLSFDSNGYIQCINDAIRDSIKEHGFDNAFGTYKLLEIKASNKANESSPIVYYLATKEIMMEFLKAINTPM
jgi:hypothetical protein